MHPNFNVYIAMSMWKPIKLMGISSVYTKYDANTSQSGAI